MSQFRDWREAAVHNCVVTSWTTMDTVHTQPRWVSSFVHLSQSLPVLPTAREPHMCRGLSDGHRLGLLCLETKLSKPNKKKSGSLFHLGISMRLTPNLSSEKPASSCLTFLPSAIACCWYSDPSPKPRFKITASWSIYRKFWFLAYYQPLGSCCNVIV